MPVGVVTVSLGGLYLVITIIQEIRRRAWHPEFLDVPPTARVRLTARAENLTLGYDGRSIIAALSTAIPDGSFTVIIGPNACGKSTLLRGLSRLLAPDTGQVVLDGKAITSMP